MNDGAGCRLCSLTEADWLTDWLPIVRPFVCFLLYACCMKYLNGLVNPGWPTDALCMHANLYRHTPCFGYHRVRLLFSLLCIYGMESPCRLL